MMNQFLLFCKDQSKSANDLLLKLSSSDKWTLTTDAGNIVPDNIGSFRIESSCTMEEISKELYDLFNENIFIVGSI